MSPRISQRLIAKEVGVSPKTVSLAMNRRPGVSPSLTRAILETAQRLGYSRSRDPGTSRRALGIVLPYIGQVVNNELLQLLRELAISYHYTPLIGEFGGKPEEEQRLIADLWHAGIDGLIDISPRLPTAFFAEHSLNTRPIVIINRPLLDPGSHLSFDSISLDHTYGARLAMDHLIVSGCKRIAYLAGPRPSTNDRARREGYKHAIQEHGLEYIDELVVEIDMPRTPPWPSMESGKRQCERLLAKKIDFDAIMAFNDEIAIGALRALEDMKPRDQKRGIDRNIAIIGFGHTRLGEFSVPSLTTVGVQPQKLAWIAMSAIMERLEGVPKSEDPPRDQSSIGHHILAPELIHRDSCRHIPRK